MKKLNKYIRICATILLFISVFFFTFAMFGKKEPGEAYIGDFGTFQFNEGWAVRGDNEYQNITLPIVWDNQQKITLVLENTLPSYVSDGMRLMMRTALQDAYFFIDGELRAQYTQDSFKHVKGRLPNSYVTIDLTDVDAGKKMEIHLITETQVRLNEVQIGYGNNAWFSLLKSNIPVLGAAFVLVVGGLIAVGFHFTLGRALQANNAVLFLGEAMIVIGLWIMSESRIRQLIFKSPSYSAIFAYTLCELIGGFICLYFNEVQKHKYDKIYTTLQILVFGQASLNAILGFSGIAAFYETLFLSHIWMLVGFIVVTATVVIDLKTKYIKNYSIMAWGMFVFVVFCLLEITDYYTKDFFVLGKYLCIGFLALLAATLIQTIKDEIQKIKQAAELEREKEAAVSANRAKSEFLARMSHEIRTPVNTVLGMNEMILRESREDHIREYAQDVKNSSLTLLSLINEILDSSKVEAGKMEIVSVDYEMGSLLNNLYNMIKTKAEDKGLELIFDVDVNIPKAYYGDDKRIRQILINLLTNAVKYTEKGTVTLKVSRMGGGEDAKLLFVVKDTGIGIKGEDVDKVFDKFQRFDLSRNMNVEGTGLGMNIVQQLLELMGSEIHIYSEYGKGSEFSFELIQKIVDKAPLGDFRSRLLSANEESERKCFTAPEARILVVDDYSMNLKVFRNLLKQTKMQIVEALSGKECLEILKEQKFDLIFLDHMMPEMDGIETLHLMKENKLSGETPVIMLTANAIVGDKEKYFQEGFNDFISKPIIPGELDKMILKHLSSDLVRTENEAKETQNKRFKSEELNLLSRCLPEIDFEKAMVYCSGSEEFYLELLQDFVNLPIKKELSAYYQKGSYKNYSIRVHAFKNNAYSIGAQKLGDLSCEIEKLTKEGFPDEICDKQEELFEQFEKICRQYAKAISR